MTPSKTQPTLLRQLATCDSEERGKTRFGSEHVVACRVKFLFCHIVANREHPAFGIYEKAEVSFFSNVLDLKSDCVKASCESTQIMGGFGKGGSEALAE